ncbi:MAG TPA: hypothetical protein VFS49_11050 [Croceibacterium sp.]|nr:hypothetical protein [Croceibacterium sp.]
MIRVRHPHAVLWLLLAAALFMRAFVPEGYMPERSASGAITVRVCGSGHLIKIPTGPRETPGKADRAQPQCAFAGLGIPALPPPAIAALPAPAPREELFAEAGGAALSLSPLLPSPPARGPPPAA